MAKILIHSFVTEIILLTGHGTASLVFYHSIQALLKKNNNMLPVSETLVFKNKMVI